MTADKTITAHLLPENQLAFVQSVYGTVVKNRKRGFWYSLCGLVIMDLSLFGLWLSPFGLNALNLICIIAFMAIFVSCLISAIFFSARIFHNEMRPYIDSLEPEARRVYELCLVALRSRIRLNDVHTWAK